MEKIVEKIVSSVNKYFIIRLRKRDNFVVFLACEVNIIYKPGIIKPDNLYYQQF